MNLDEAPESPSALRFLTLSEPPRYVFFSESFKIQDEPYALAVVLSENAISIIDLEHLDRTPTTVDLRSDNRRSVFPEHVLFDAQNSRVYVRGSGADDVFSLRLIQRTPEGAQNSFLTSVDIIAAGKKPTDMQLFSMDGETKLLVIAEASRTAVVVDVATSRTLSVKLPAGFDHAFVYETTEGGRTVSAALLWDKGGRALVRVDLSNFETQLERGLEALTSLPNKPNTVVPLQDGRIVVLHSGQGLTLVDPAARSVTPFSSRHALGGGYLDEENGRLWLAPRNQDTVAFLSLEDGSTDEVKLDSQIYMATPAFTGGKLAVIHDDVIGHVTFVDTAQPGRTTSRSIRGFILEGILD